MGEDLQLHSGDDVFTAEILGKVFQDEEGNYIEQTVSPFNSHLHIHVQVECSV